MDEKQTNRIKQGNLILENRKKLSVSGICDVESFDEKRIVFITEDSLLSVTGNNMKIKSLSAESGEAVVEGDIDGCVYSHGKQEKEGFLKRVLK